MVLGDTLILIPLLISALMIFGILPGRGRLSAAMLIFLVLVHVVAIGFRWQMAPGYLLAVILTFFLAAGRRQRWNSAGGVVMAAVVLGSWTLSVTLSIFLPLFELPRPTGPYTIGTRFLTVVDSTRAETLTVNDDDYRTLYIQVWYPARDGGRRAPYWRDTWKASSIAAASQGLGMLPFLWSHLGLIRTHALQNAPVSLQDPSYPVVVFSHGYGQIASFNTALIEEIVSHGYAVFNLYHTYETPFVVTEEGKVIQTTPDEEAMATPRMQSDRRAPVSSLAQLRDTSRLVEMDEMIQHLYRDGSFFLDRTDCWAEDILFALHRIPDISEEQFEGRLDSERVAVMGWSFGGGAAGVAALVDSNVSAGVNLDGWQYGHLLGRNLTTPFLFLMSEEHGDANQFFIDGAEADVYRLILRGAGHSNFTDLALSAELPGKLTGRLGTMDGRRGSEVSHKVVIEFLDRYLRGRESPFLDGSLTGYPEIDLEAKRTPARR